MISGSESSSENFYSSVMSFITCVQNLRSIGRDLIGSGIVCRNWKFQSSLGLNLCVIRVLVLLDVI